MIVDKLINIISRAVPNVEIIRTKCLNGRIGKCYKPIVCHTDNTVIGTT